MTHNNWESPSHVKKQTFVRCVASLAGSPLSLTDEEIITRADALAAKVVALLFHGDPPATDDGTPTEPAEPTDG